jgi:hypothetical protein
MEAYVAGVSTPGVDDLVAALGIDSGISNSEVSRICAGLDAVVTAFRTIRLDHIEFPSGYLDATYLHVRNATLQIVPMAVVVATGITDDGGREALGLDVGDSEDEVFWRGFLAAAKRRGLARGAVGHLRPARRTRRRSQALVSGYDAWSSTPDRGAATARSRWPRPVKGSPARPFLRRGWPGSGEGSREEPPAGFVGFFS